MFLLINAMLHPPFPPTNPLPPHVRLPRVPGWNRVAVVVRGANSTSGGNVPIVLEVVGPGLQLSPLNAFLLQTRYHEVALRKLNVGAKEERTRVEAELAAVASALLDLEADVHGDPSGGGDLAAAASASASVVRLSWAELASELAGATGDDDGTSRVNSFIRCTQSEGGNSMPPALAFLFSMVSSMRETLSEPAEGVATLARRQFLILDADNSGTLDRDEICQLLFTLHSHGLPRAEIQGLVDAAWADVGGTDGGGDTAMDLEQFQRLHATVLQRSSLGVDVEHDIVHIGSGHCASALFKQVGIIRGGGSDRTATAHPTASSYSSVWQISDEPEVLWERGASLEKEVRILGHLA